MQNMIKIKSKTHPNVVPESDSRAFCNSKLPCQLFFGYDNLKSRLSEASVAARELSRQIEATTVVDTIVCIDGCEIIGAFLAEELTRAGIYSMIPIRPST